MRKSKILKEATNRELKRVLKSKDKEIESLYQVINFKDILSKREEFVRMDIAESPDLKEQCAVITQLTDAHVDEIVNPRKIQGLNSYNPDEARRRIQRYFKRLLYMINQDKKAGINITNLIIHFGGDALSGWIHEELMHGTAMTPVQGAIFYKELILAGLQLLSERLEIPIVIVCSCGNHTRTTEKWSSKFSVQTSYEYLIHKDLEFSCQLLKLNNISFVIGEGQFEYYTIFGKNNMFCHGNSFGYHGGVGGIEVPMNRWILREKMIIADIDMIWLGHWHQKLSLRMARCGGSIIGYNEYARGKSLPPELPMMHYQLLDKKRGYTTNKPIILVDF